MKERTAREGRDRGRPILAGAPVRRFSVRAGRAFGFGVCAVLVVGSALRLPCAFGQSAAREAVRVSYRSEGLCPSGERFFADVRARTEKIRPAAGDEPARTFKVEVIEGPTESRGSLSIMASDGTASSPRTVRARTCADVVTALALVAALAMDPEARTAPLFTDASAGGPEPPADRTAPPEDAGADRNEPPPRAMAADASAPTDARPATSDASRVLPSVPVETRVSFGGGAEGSSVLGLRPALTLAVGLDFLRADVLSPAFTLRLTRSFRGTTSLATGAANVTFSAAAIEPCPLRFRLGDTLAVLPCARVAFGFVEAEGSSVTTPAKALRGWGDVGAHVRVSWAIAGPISLDVHGGARFPLFRDRFFVDQGTTLYEVPSAVGAFGGDLRFVLP